MSLLSRFAVVAVVAAFLSPHDVHAAKKTVCTITVNSSDEREVFRRSLPADQFEFVELVERGRPDWLASACQKGVRCDALLISGHFDGGDEFYSDRVDARESLPVDEMERASCSDSCPGLFSQLKEVYLFGCNTLNADALKSVSAEAVRSLIRSGHSPADAERLAQVLNERHAGSNRDRMRQIFKDVPVIYGFSSKAPLGRSAGPVLERYFQAGGAGEVASGRVSGKLLSLFAPVSMTVTAGATDRDAQAGYRSDVCRFADDRLSTEQKLAFVHQLLGRDMAEVRMFLDHLEKYAAAVAISVRESPAVAKALEAITDDRPARDRYLEFVRDADHPAVRARMIRLAARLGWLTADEKHAELVRMIESRLDRSDVGDEDIDLVCTLNADHALDDALQGVKLTAARLNNVGSAGLFACLGNPLAHARVLKALSSASAAEVAIAQVYLRHRPIVDVRELRVVAVAIARMKNAEAQVRALDTLARHQVADHESLEVLTRLFPATRSIDVQRAIAGILIRADYSSIAKPDLVQALSKHRLKSSDGRDLIDVLIRRLQANLAPAAEPEAS
jgi:hypothetical protein